MGKRYRWDTVAKCLVEQREEWAPTSRQVARADVSFMDGVAATDGTDIGSKRKRREYMKINGLADADDYTQEWKTAAKERAAIRSGEHDRKARKEAVERALYQLHKP
jgi:hypothetical protein